MKNLSNISSQIKPIALKAGEIIMSYLLKDKKIEYKEEINMVTEADKESENYIVKSLKELFPNDGILAEENHKIESKSGYTWVIDPLDGTTSFSHNFPFFAVSIALVNEKNIPVLGVVYNPFYNEYFEAYENSGAKLNSKPINVSTVDNINKALIGTGFPYYRREHMQRILNRLGNFLNVVHDMRRTGSAALDICFVAAGRLDAYYEEGLKPWDTAAAYRILIEAGGMASKFDGKDFDINFPEIIASNAKIHPQVIKLC
ncbi:MAG: inositol monophosphatase [Spirochaetia bacterium]|nr:inositol monophosphatase [Spirochaetia bacterium]